MNNFTLAQKQALQAQAQSGKKVAFMTYDPTKGPAPTAPAGFSVYYTESAPTAVETVYTK